MAAGIEQSLAQEVDVMKEGFVYWLEEDLYRTCVFVGFHTLGAEVLQRRLGSIQHYV
jgi:hypothetical protein